MSINQLVYVSEATVEFDRLRLVALLGKARDFNATADISGVLLCGDGRFAQCLEGPAAAVDDLYNKIASDKRHTNVTLLQTVQVPKRSFAQWSMGCVNTSESELLKLRTAEWEHAVEEHQGGPEISPGFALMGALWKQYQSNAV